jgi:hypothetical protein
MEETIIRNLILFSSHPEGNNKEFLSLWNLLMDIKLDSKYLILAEG